MNCLSGEKPCFSPVACGGRKREKRVRPSARRRLRGAGLALSESDFYCAQKAPANCHIQRICMCAANNCQLLENLPLPLFAAGIVIEQV